MDMCSWLLSLRTACLVQVSWGLHTDDPGVSALPTHAADPDVPILLLQTLRKVISSPVCLLSTLSSWALDYFPSILSPAPPQAPRVLTLLSGLAEKRLVTHCSSAYSPVLLAGRLALPDACSHSPSEASKHQYRSTHPLILPTYTLPATAETGSFTDLEQQAHHKGWIQGMVSGRANRHLPQRVRYSFRAMPSPWSLGLP